MCTSDHLGLLNPHDEATLREIIGYVAPGVLVLGVVVDAPGAGLHDDPADAALALPAEEKAGAVGWRQRGPPLPDVAGLGEDADHPVPQQRAVPFLSKPTGIEEVRVSEQNKA